MLETPSQHCYTYYVVISNEVYMILINLFIDFNSKYNFLHLNINVIKVVLL